MPCFSGFSSDLLFSDALIGKQGSGTRGTTSYRMQGMFCPFVGLYVLQSFWAAAPEGADDL